MFKKYHIITAKGKDSEYGKLVSGRGKNNNALHEQCENERPLASRETSLK